MTTARRATPLHRALRAFTDGLDVGSPVDFSYKLPFAFTGAIDRVTFNLM